MWSALKKYKERHDCNKGNLPASFCDYVRAYYESTPQKNSPVSSVRFVVLDTETTGLNPAKDELLSIGAISVVGGSILVGDTFEQIIQSALPVDRKSVVIHGILPEHSKQGITEQEMLNDFLEYLGGAVVVAHHAAFDIAMINKSIKRIYGGMLHNQVLDTAQLAIRLEKGTRRGDGTESGDYSLDRLLDRYQITAHDRHTAWGDAFLTAQLFLKLLHKTNQRKIKKIKDLLG